MAVLHRILVILLLVLSLVALVLGLKLFNQRDEIKGRDHTLAQKTLDLAKTIEAETGQELTTKGLATMDTKLTADQLKKYYRVDPQTKQKATTGEGTMAAALDELVGRAQNQYTRLNETRDGLDQTQKTLAETKTAKEKVEGDLAAEKKITKDQGEKITAQTDELKQKADSIAQLEEAKKGLQEKAEDQKTQLDKLEQEKKDLVEAKKQDGDLIKSLQRKIAVYEGVASGQSIPIAPGRKGQVLYVNPTWNFVVLGLTKDSEVVPNVDLIVHRQDKFIGKIRISEVKSDFNLAVAEIVNDRQQGTIQEGDDVIF